ncbi:hypothetical protein PC117_g14998 [Phytophthora cactorum]|uniref:Uncharacterized protein n=1 Tax=Phytophthora cactorum TaxID=29920 RepID=A0A8T1CQQ2_9STRA|nr:hypothetical protein PC117_g14998 [Phytophthora cactorum]
MQDKARCLQDSKNSGTHVAFDALLTLPPSRWCPLSVGDLVQHQNLLLILGIQVWQRSDERYRFVSRLE